jgi:hypothetical protein
VLNAKEATFALTWEDAQRDEGDATERMIRTVVRGELGVLRDLRERARATLAAAIQALRSGQASHQRDAHPKL